jgi:hypothetical protein
LLISERDRTKKEKGTAMVRQVKSQHFLKHSKIFFMLTLNRKLLLDSLIKHETLTFTDIGKEHNLGLVPNEHRLQILLDELENDSSIKRLDGAVPCTYTVTDKGIAEGNVLKVK